MLKRLSLKKIGEKVTQSKSRILATGPTLAKGVVIGEKRPREDLASSPSKKGKADDNSKGNEASQAPEAKKKVYRPGDVTCSKATPSPRPGEGTSTNLGTALGPSVPILGSPSMAEKLLRGVIPPIDKENVEKITWNQTATKLFHVIGTRAWVLLGCSEQRGRGRAEARAREQQAVDELIKMKVDQDSFAEERSGVLVVELREKMTQAQTSAVEEFKSLSNFFGAIEDAAFKHFGEGFDFCKWQLCRHHPDLAIDLECMGFDYDLLVKEDEVEKMMEKEGENEEDGGKDKGDVNPLLFE
ncbi:hypothetical protein Acr_10g0009160 [Actinidia rufa]|uniref:Uncharacterized protein n=1 Tax=Actinidia rufa TaxID=165716 RepID=A0A7J0FA53_9ERIC|nr:hypothetical protein Acr_10g0009160 [Actinidia rufa]